MNELKSGSYINEWDGPQCSKCLGTGRDWNYKTGQWSPDEDCNICDGEGIQKVRKMEDSDSMMVDCAGGCRQKVLTLNFDPATSWSDQASYFYCIECRAKQIKIIR